MSVSMEVSPLLRIQYGRKREVQPLRGVDAYASEEEQKRRGQEARKRLVGKPPRPLMPPIPSVVENVKTIQIPRACPVGNSWEYAPVSPYDSFVPDPELGWEMTIRRILKEHGYRIEEVRIDMRGKALMECRRAIAIYLRNECRWSYPHIARFMHRDHSSILSLVGKRKRTGTHGDHTGKRLHG